MTGDLIVGLDEMKADPALYEFNVNITKDYPNMLTVPNETVDETAERFIEHVKDNLLYLHDKVPDGLGLVAKSGTMVREQLQIIGQQNMAFLIHLLLALAALSPQKIGIKT